MDNVTGPPRRGRPFAIVAALFGMTVSVFLSGCAGADGSEGGSKPDVSSTVTDGSGAEVTTSGTVTRVVCLTGICDDTMVALGMKPAASTSSGPDGLLSKEYLLGSDAADVPKVGGSFGEENLEQIFKAEPDLVVGLVGTHETVRDSLAGGAPVYLAAVPNYKASIEFVEWMGKVTGKTEKAKEVIAHFQDAVQKAKKSTNHEASSIAIFGSDVNFGVDTKDGVVGSILAELGNYPWEAPPGSGGGHQPGSGSYSLEDILQKNPTVMFVQTFSFGSSATTPLSQQLAANPIWSKLDAVKNGKVIEVDTAVWGTGRGLLSLEQVINTAEKAMA